MSNQNNHSYKALKLLLVFSICQFAALINAQDSALQTSTRSVFARFSNNWRETIAQPALARWQELPTSYKWGIGIVGGVSATLATWKAFNSIRDYRDPAGAARRAFISKDTGKLQKAINRVTTPDAISKVIKKCWNQDQLNQVFFSHHSDLTEEQLLHLLFPERSQVPADFNQYSTNIWIENELIKNKNFSTTQQLMWVLEHKSNNGPLCLKYIRNLISFSHADPFEQPTEVGGKNGFVLMCEKLRPITLVSGTDGKYPAHEALNAAFNTCFPEAKYVDYSRGTSNETQRNNDKKACLKKQFTIFLNLANNSDAETNYFALCKDHFEEQDWLEVYALLPNQDPNVYTPGLEIFVKVHTKPILEAGARISSSPASSSEQSGPASSSHPSLPVVNLQHLEQLKAHLKTAIDTNSKLVFSRCTQDIDWTTYQEYLNCPTYEHAGRTMSPILYSFITAEKNQTEPIIGRLLIEKALSFHHLNTKRQAEILGFFAVQAVDGRCITYLKYILEHRLSSTDYLFELRKRAANYQEALAYLDDYINRLPGRDSSIPITRIS